MAMRGLGLLCLLALQDPPVRDLVDRMRTESAAARNLAFDRLHSLGRSAEMELRRAAEDPDPELASRSRALLRTLTLRESLPPKLLRTFPGLDVRLAQDPAAWTFTLIDAARRKDCGDLIHLELDWTDLNALALEALRNASHPEDQQAICCLVGEHGLRSALPQLHALLENADLETKRSALQALCRLRSPESIVPISRLLEDPELRREAGVALGRYGRASVIRFLEPLTAHPDRETRSALVDLLRYAGSECSIPLLSRMTRDSDPLIRAEALLTVAPIQDQISTETLIGYLSCPVSSIRNRAYDLLRRSRNSGRFPQIRLLLGSPHSEIRVQAATVLGDFHDEDSISDLMDLLDDADWQVRASAVGALLNLRARQAIPSLSRLMTDPSERVRSLSGRALAMMKVPEAIEHYLAQLRDGSDAERLEAIRLFYSFSIPEAVPELAHLAQTAKGDLRLEAIRMLGNWELKAQAPVLVPLLVSTEESVAERAESALVTMRAQEVTPQLIALLSHAESSVRQRAISILSQMRAPEAVPHLLRLLDDPEQPVRLEATRAMDNLPVPAAIPRLRTFLKEPDPELRLAAAGALTAMNVTDAAVDLLPLLKDEEEQFEVMRHLRTLGNRRAVPALAALLDSSNYRTRHSALQAMLALDGVETVGALRQIVRIVGHAVREPAIHGLASIGAWDAVPDLLLCLQDCSASIQDAAADALAQLGVREAVPVILARLGEDRAGMRTSLVNALGRLGAVEAGPRILELLGHQDSAVVRSAIEAAGTLNLREAVRALLGLSQGDDLLLRSEASAALIRLGDRSDVPTILEGGPRDLFLLNRLRRPELWERLRTSPRLRNCWRYHSGTWSELACDAGLEISIEILPDHYWDQRQRAEPSQGGMTTLLEQMEESLYYYSFSIILEDDRLRIVPIDSARRFWVEWWRRNPDR